MSLLGIWQSIARICSRHCCQLELWVNHPSQELSTPVVPKTFPLISRDFVRSTQMPCTDMSPPPFLEECWSWPGWSEWHPNGHFKNSKYKRCHNVASIWKRFSNGVLSALVAFMMKNSKTGPETWPVFGQPQLPMLLRMLNWCPHLQLKAYHPGWALHSAAVASHSCFKLI